MVHLTALERMRLQFGAEHLHSLGARASAEFLAEICRNGCCVSLVLTTLHAYQNGPSVQIVRAVGGDRFPPRILQPVQE